MQKDTKGLLLKGIGGFYYVETDCGVVECKARGIFRNKDLSPLVGDRVLIEKTEDGKGVINEILPRKNQLRRPPVSNLDQLIFVVSICEPYPNTLVLDKLIAIAEYKKIDPVIVITKTDIQSGDSLCDCYASAGFRTFLVSGSAPETAEPVKQLLEGKVSAFTGNSGVGKSTLLNNIDQNLSLETADISKKLGRGRHTTRQVELYKLDNGGYVADTPGFSAMDMDRYEIILKDDLQYCFREFEHYLGKCQFHGCSHTDEKGCAVLEAVREGKIQKSRHESYVSMYEDAKKLKEWEYSSKNTK